MSLESYNSFFNRVNGAEETPKGPKSGGDQPSKDSHQTIGNINSENLSFGSEAGPGFSRGDYSFGANFGWTPSLSLDGSSKYTNMFTGATYGSATGKTTSGGNGVSYSDNKSEPKMTVDEVYGKGNQSIVEDQGDYSASSNEKSNVETSTFGKQNDITITPVSVTENKGIVDNSTIESVEGLDFQQKDKESQDVLDSRKKRDEAEVEDKSNQIRDKIKAAVTGTTEDTNDFQIGDRNEDVAKAKAEVDRLANEKTKYENELKKNADQLKIFNEKAEEKEQAIKQEDADYQAKKANTQHLHIIGKNIQGIEKLLDTIPTGVDGRTMVKSAQISLDNLASKLGVDAVDLPTNNIQEALETFRGWENSLRQEYFEGLKDFSPNSINAYRAGIDELHLTNLQRFTDELDSLAGGAKLIEQRQEQLKGKIADNEKKSGEAQTAYDNLVNNTFTDEVTTSTPEETTVPESVAETTTPTSKAETAITTAKEAINNSTNASEEEKAAATEALDVVNNSRDKVAKAAGKLTENLDNVSDEDIDAYMKALKELNKNYEDANDKVSFFKRTDFNKQYVTAIAKANDFEVTLADGSKMSFSEFSAKMATKSPRIAEAMYNVKADSLKEKHPVLAKIERNKAKMVGNWFGSKFTFTDDLVRNQFNQMAETNIRATYAAYNNVLNNANATPEQKADAESQIQQANSLMRASAALKASTGFWSGIGDGMGDGTYGTTDPGDLNAYQKTLSKIGDFTKVILGLGVTPGANRAYQNMYYLAGDDVDKSALFNKDFNNDGFALCQEYGNSATAGMIAGAGELSTGVALMFNPSTMSMGASLIGDSVGTFLDGLYGVASDVNKSEDYTRAVLRYFEEAEDIAEKGINVDAGNEEVVAKIKSVISQIENFKLGSEEANSFNNWLEGSGSNTTDGGKFNQALTYEEWLKLIEADPTMREYARKLITEKKNAKESNADTGVNS